MAGHQHQQAESVRGGLDCGQCAPDTFHMTLYDTFSAELLLAPHLLGFSDLDMQTVQLVRTR